MVQEAEMYSALYRIEYEKFTNEAARQGWEHWNLVLLMMEHLRRIP
jgi:hypothetical protein